VVGVLILVFANDITRFTLHPQTAESQYAAVDAAEKENAKQQAQLQKQIRELSDTKTLPNSFDDNVTRAVADFTTLEEGILKKCPNIAKINTSARQHINDDPERDSRPELFSELKIIPIPWERIGEYSLFTPVGGNIVFSNQESAIACKNIFLENTDNITEHLRIIQDLLSKKDTARREILKSKEPELKPLRENINRLQVDRRNLDVLSAETQKRVIEERVLGGQITPEGQKTNDKTDTKIDWARVIETNATRIGALVTMFFLVTILVPQYRYNIRMASFYEARSDSLGMLPEQMSAEDFDKVVNIMTPNIDFGKAPPTPWEQIIEVIKTAKS
jgi:hypothetical protein